ncbi:MAG TPA: HNH endonuclease signature motif containing protein [Chloroflexota bacterium]|nr:HNH endonuclease signature motif containing protein [Chloroflexota bacterium]
MRKLRPVLAVAANHRCGYCQTQEVVSGIPLTVEHLLPRAQGGKDEEENLWLSCRLCNEAKSGQTHVPDPQTDQIVSLFNPRTQQWSGHFAWSEDGTIIQGLTPNGRATIHALDLNSEFRVRSRALWVEIGKHPPT